MLGLGSFSKTPPLSSRFIFNETRIVVQCTDALDKSTYVDMMASPVPYDILFWQTLASESQPEQVTYLNLF